jgi:hypothetical protein
MGAFTEDNTTVMELIKMKIPVWHIHPSYKLLLNMNIHQVVQLSTPCDMVTLNYRPDPFPIACTQGPGTIRLTVTQHVGASCINLFKDVSTMPDLPTSMNDEGAHPAPHKLFILSIFRIITDTCHS